MLTIIMYLYVSFTDPGYVTSYVMRGDEYEDDIENMKEYGDKSNNNSEHGRRHKQKKVKVCYIRLLSIETFFPI